MQKDFRFSSVEWAVALVTELADTRETVGVGRLYHFGQIEFEDSTECQMGKA